MGREVTFDSLTALKEYLEDNWGDHEPALQDYYNVCSHTWHNTIFKIYLDERNVHYVAPQLLLETYPLKEIHVTDDLARIEQQVKVTAFVRPVNYTEDSIDDAKLIFRGLKTRFNELMIASRYSVSYEYFNGSQTVVQKIAQIDLGEWDDKDTVIRGHDVKARHNPIEFRSSQIIKLIYHNVEEQIS